jgi:hypothetical protein
LTDADVVVLRKFRPLAPDFHRHMLPGRLDGKVIQVGDRVLVYEVDETIPPGPVTVTPMTRLEVR